LIKRLLISCLLAAVLANPLFAGQPKLVLLVTVDQLRGDMPWRFQDRFGPAGFRYLMDQGTSFSNAHFEHASTLTGPGHATLATGGNPPQHGIVGNDWFDVELQRSVNCVEDVQHPLIGSPPGTPDGRSPANLTSSTFGDELVLASGGRSRVFSVSVKDRGAILMAGRFGKAWWFSKTTGEFVSSTYYYNKYPAWVVDWNAAKHADRYREETWDLLHEQESYVFGEQDDRLYEKSYKYLGRTFPHVLGNDDRKSFYAVLGHTPMADQLVLSFVQKLVTAENIGQAGGTDLLAVSFSATDYIGHAFGPNSLEAEDNLLRLDRTLAGLFQFIDREVGLDNTLVMLAADHGTNAAPEHMQALGFTAGRHRPEQFMARANAALQRKFNTDRELAQAFLKPGIYLDLEAVEMLGAPLAEVERALAEEIMNTEGFTLALTRTDLLSGSIPDTPLARSVQAAFHPVRSGNVTVVQDPYWFLGSAPDSDAAMHGSPHPYDTHVPIMFAGPGVAQRKIVSRVAPRDIAPTLSAYFGIPAPSSAVGNPLTDVLD